VLGTFMGTALSAADARPRRLPTTREARLTRREREVARLVREGLSNCAIADLPRPCAAQGHVASLLNRLGVEQPRPGRRLVAENVPGR
jgi:DNA-binding NarL/FixJ family response regulator